MSKRSRSKEQEKLQNERKRFSKTSIKWEISLKALNMEKIFKKKNAQCKTGKIP